MTKKHASTPAEIVLPTPADLLNDRAVAAILGVTPRAVRGFRKRRGLPHIRLSQKVILTRRGDLEAWLRTNTVGQTPHE